MPQSPVEPIAPVLPGAAQIVVPAINHLLAPEAWARQALARHAGKSLRATMGPVSVHLRFDADGQVSSAPAGRPPDASVVLPLASLAHLANRDAAALQANIKLEGDAGLAQDVSEVARHLRWDVEEDLARAIGDIAAHRVVSGARDLLATVRTSQRKFAENLAEYWLEERPELVRPRQLDAHAGALRSLRDHLARLEKRIERLERR